MIEVVMRKKKIMAKARMMTINSTLSLRLEREEIIIEAVMSIATEADATDTEDGTNMIKAINPEDIAINITIEAEGKDTNTKIMETETDLIKSLIISHIEINTRIMIMISRRKAANKKQKVHNNISLLRTHQSLMIKERKILPQ